jgi:hypothetical protein
MSFDVPLSAALKVDVDLFHDADCSSSQPAKRVDEVETRYLSEEEEARLKAVLNAAGHAWKIEYCISKSKEGQRVGYNASIVGRLANPKAVPPFIELVFTEVHRLPAVRAIEIETDE